MLQLRSTWGSSLSSLDRAVNDEIQKLEATVHPTKQQLKVQDVKIYSMPNGMTWAYNAHILYEVCENDSPSKK